MNPCSIGVDLGGTSIRMGALYGGELHALTRVPSGDASAETLCDALSRYIAGLDGPAPGAVCIGIPGTLDERRETVLNTPNLPRLCGAALAARLRDALGIPVMLENDTVPLLYGDLHLLGIGASGTAIGCYIGTGLGGAVFIDGRAPNSQHGLCEPGHIPIPGRFEPCTCGNLGCAENYVSGRYLQALRRSQFPDVPIERLFTALRGTPLLDTYVDTLACVLAAMVNLLDPHVLVLGGGVAAMQDFPRTALEAALRRRAMHPVPAESLRIVYSANAQGAGVLGAALMAAQELL